MIAITLIISFLLDNIVSNFISLNSIFMPLFTLMSLIIIYPYFNNRNKKNFLITCFVIGICYDLIYTNTIVIHGFLFLLVGLIVMRLNIVFSNSYFNVAIMGAIIIVIYRVIMYIFLLITGNISFDLLILFRSIYSSLILNLIYVSFLYIITDRISYRLRIHKAN